MLLALKVCSRGYKLAREEKDPKSGERNERVLRAQSLLSRVLVSCSCIFISWFGLVRIWIPLMGLRESAGYSGGKEKNEREREEGL